MWAMMLSQVQRYQAYARECLELAERATRSDVRQGYQPCLMEAALPEEKARSGGLRSMRVWIDNATLDPLCARADCADPAGSRKISALHCHGELIAIRPAITQTRTLLADCGCRIYGDGSGGDFSLFRGIADGAPAKASCSVSFYEALRHEPPGRRRAAACLGLIKGKRMAVAKVPATRAGVAPTKLRRRRGAGAGLIRHRSSVADCEDVGMLRRYGEA